MTEYNWQVIENSQADLFVIVDPRSGPGADLRVVCSVPRHNAENVPLLLAAPLLLTALTDLLNVSPSGTDVRLLIRAFGGVSESAQAAIAQYADMDSAQSRARAAIAAATGGTE